MRRIVGIAVFGIMSALLVSLPAYGCEACYTIQVPDPDGGPPTARVTCLDLAGHGWYLCTTGGLLGWLGGCCWVDYYCFDPEWPPEPDPDP